MKPRSGILVTISLVLGLLLFQSLPAQGASLTLSVPDGKAGSTVTATLGFADATGVASFTATLYYPSEYAFFTPGSFTPNVSFLPSVPIGTGEPEDANFSILPSGGVFTVVGLKPNTTTGTVSIGTLPFTISAAAITGDERVVTLSGEIYTEEGTVLPLTPVSVLFTVGDPEPLTLTTAPVSSITQTTATSGGNITSDGGAEVTARGVCWSTSPNPTVDLPTKTIDGSGTGSFVSNLTGLTPGTPYYIRAYATNSEGTAYGNEVSFTTLAGTPTLTTAAVSSITQTTVTSGGNVTSDGGAAVTARGVCWSTSPNPTTANSKTNNGAGTGAFVSNLTGLTPGTPYYVRAYATNSEGTAYGNEVSFTTLAGTPTLTTAAVSSITQTAATSGGNVTSDGGAAVTARGVCWSTSPNPTTANNKTNNGTGTGAFVSNLTGLTPGTPYYIRAYATNSEGTAYGNEVYFTTSIGVPSMTTAAVSSIGQTTATSGGNVTSDGGAPVTARGVCWSTSPNPTTTDSKTNDGSGAGSFVSNLTGLTPGTPYYIRAYATNSEGTDYGNEVSFTTADAADLFIEKTVDRSDAEAGDTVVFTIRITNRGPCDAADVRVLDILSAAFQHVSDDSGGLYDPNSGTWSVGNLSATAPNNTAVLHITCTVMEPGQSLNIASVVDVGGLDPELSDNSSAVLLNSGAQADLFVVKTVNEDFPLIGEEIVFRVIISNNSSGNATAIQVMDLLPEGLTYGSSTPSQGSYEPSTGAWNVGDLVSHSRATLELTATVTSEDEIVNTVRVAASDHPDPDITNNASSVVLNPDMVEHPLLVDLALQKTVNLCEVDVEEEVVFTIVVRNNGPYAAHAVDVEDLLPDGLTFVRSVPSQGSYNAQTGIWHVGEIPAGAFAILDLAAAVEGTEVVNNTARVSHVDEWDMDPANDSASATVTGVSRFGPDIRANGSDGPVVLSHGDPVSITISLDPGEYAGFKADWWIAVKTPFAPPGNWYTYVHPTGWKPGVNLCAQTALFDVAPFEVLNMALPVGNYTFYFAVDPPDGIPTAELVDSVQVEVTP